MIADFSFVVRDEIQSFHWNNEPATVHTFMGYYKLKKTTTSLCYLVISENNQHDTIAVHLFQRKLVDFLTQHFGGNKPHKIYRSVKMLDMDILTPVNQTTEPTG